jgi:RNA 3'-terminal phosphate cyclase (ATP)
MAAYGQDFIDIDGSYGEGGGQVLRTALALSAIQGRPLRIGKIRKGRKKPGLQPQHLKAAEALARITRGHLTGATVGSDSVIFIPQEIVPGDYRVDIGTAGSVTLLLQALLPAICLGRAGFRLTLTGGTHVPWSPPFHYLDEVLFPVLRKMGIGISAVLEQWGWYPRGGGLIRVEVEPAGRIKPLILTDRGPLKGIRGLSVSSNLPVHIPERQRQEALRRIKAESGRDAEFEVISDAPAFGQGSFVFLKVDSENVAAGFSGLGERGKRAEEVAAEAADELKDYLLSTECLDPHLADQITIYMGLAEGASSFTVSRITQHLLTNLWVIQQFLDVQVTVEGEAGEKGKIEILSGRREERHGA